jgi:hypothetical protein
MNSIQQQLTSKRRILRTPRSNKKRRIEKKPTQDILPFDCWNIIVEFCDTKTWLNLQVTSQLFNSMKCKDPPLPSLMNKPFKLNVKFDTSYGLISREGRFEKKPLPIGIITLNRNNTVTNDIMCQFRNVTKLDMSYTRANNMGLLLLRNLIELKCEQCNVTSRIFKRFQNLQVVSVKRCSKITNELYH